MMKKVVARGTSRLRVTTDRRSAPALSQQEVKELQKQSVPAVNAALIAKAGQGDFDTWWRGFKKELRTTVESYKQTRFANRSVVERLERHFGRNGDGDRALQKNYLRQNPLARVFVDAAVSRLKRQSRATQVSRETERFAAFMSYGASQRAEFEQQSASLVSSFVVRDTLAELVWVRMVIEKVSEQIRTLVETNLVGNIPGIEKKFEHSQMMLSRYNSYLRSSMRPCMEALGVDESSSNALNLVLSDESRRTGVCCTELKEYLRGELANLQLKAALNVVEKLDDRTVRYLLEGVTVNLGELSIAYPEIEVLGESNPERKKYVRRNHPVKALALAWREQPASEIKRDIKDAKSDLAQPQEKWAVSVQEFMQKQQSQRAVVEADWEQALHEKQSQGEQLYFSVSGVVKKYYKLSPKVRSAARRSSTSPRRQRQSEYEGKGSPSPRRLSPRQKAARNASEERRRRLSATTMNMEGENSSLTLDDSDFATPKQSSRSQSRFTRALIRKASVVGSPYGSPALDQFLDEDSIPARTGTPRRQSMTSVGSSSHSTPRAVVMGSDADTSRDESEFFDRRASKGSLRQNLLLARRRSTSSTPRATVEGFFSPRGPAPKPPVRSSSLNRRARNQDRSKTPRIRRGSKPATPKSASPVVTTTSKGRKVFVI